MNFNKKDNLSDIVEDLSDSSNESENINNEFSDTMNVEDDQGEVVTLGYDEDDNKG